MDAPLRAATNSSKMTYKTIISGHLEFGSNRSYEKVMSMLDHRIENYYKNDVLIDIDEVFQEDTSTMDIPRLIGQASDKCFRNTVSMVEMIMQYAVAGTVHIWKLEGGKCLEHHKLEPSSDKAAIKSFLKGRELIKAGKKKEARTSFSKAIEKFERHALAYERRGHINFLLNNIDDALYDFNKSLQINPNSPVAYFGRGTIHMHRGHFAEAEADFGAAAKGSIPHQPIYWKARREKGACHLELSQYKEAAFEFKLLSNRKFDKSDINSAFKQKDLFNYGRALLGLKEFDAAIEAFDKALNLKEEQEAIPKADRLLYRGIALQKAGKDGYRNDWQLAADSGSEKAAQLLQEG
jgi:tetratricopeptide (TPR) repeat protein